MNQRLCLWDQAEIRQGGCAAGKQDKKAGHGFAQARAHAEDVVFFVEGLDASAQQHYFDGQLALAHEFDLPVIVHARRAVDTVIASFKRIGKLRGVVHSFSGSAEQARQLRELGFLIGVGGPVTWPRARRLRRLVAEMPLEFLLLETDAPDQPLEGRRGERNEPARVADVCATIAGLREASIAEIASATSENARRLFRLPA